MAGNSSQIIINAEQDGNKLKIREVIRGSISTANPVIEKMLEEAVMKEEEDEEQTDTFQSDFVVTAPSQSQTSVDETPETGNS